MKNWLIIWTIALLGLSLIPRQLAAQGIVSSPADGSVKAEPDAQIQIYPNPNDGRFQLLIERAGSEKVIARIYDITGKLIEDLSESLEREEDRLSHQVEMADPRPGIYFIRVEKGKDLHIKKFIIR